MTTAKKYAYIYSTTLLLFALLAIPYFITDRPVKKFFQFTFLFLIWGTLFLAIWEKYRGGEKINFMYLIGVMVYGILLYFILNYLKGF